MDVNGWLGILFTIYMTPISMYGDVCFPRISPPVPVNLPVAEKILW